MKTPALITIEVTGLLGQFDHTVKFPADQEFIILHGPNGVGKTKLLELISAVFSADISKLAGLPFGHAKFIFSDGTILRVSKMGQLSLIESSEDASETLAFRLISPGGDECLWEPSEANIQDIDPSL